MKLDFPGNVDQSGMCCRRSPLRGIVGGLVMCAFLIGFPILLWKLGVPRLAWGGCALLAALLVPWFLADALATLSPANWLMRLGPGGLWINLRSYQNRKLPEAATALHLDWREVAAARRHIGTWSTPMKPHSLAGTHWRQESLELILKSGETSEIAQALVDERQRRAAVRAMQQPVTVPEEGVVRIGWRGHDNDVVPPLTRVLEELRQRVKVEEPTRTEYPDWNHLSEDELDELVAQLARSGDDLSAVQLLVRRRGWSHAAAHRYVGELASRI